MYLNNVKDVRCRMLFELRNLKKIFVLIMMLLISSAWAKTADDEHTIKGSHYFYLSSTDVVVKPSHDPMIYDLVLKNVKCSFMFDRPTRITDKCSGLVLSQIWQDYSHQFGKNAFANAAFYFSEDQFNHVIILKVRMIDDNTLHITLKLYQPNDAFSRMVNKKNSRLSFSIP